jgi:hypothetical protein
MHARRVRSPFQRRPRNFSALAMRAFLIYLSPMQMLPKPEVIITHESDLDGFLSGLLLQRLAKHLFGAEVRLEAYHYNHWKLRDLREKSAWVTDFTFEARMDKPDWVVIDHHVTDVQPKSALLIHDVAKSAASARRRLTGWCI